MLSTPARRRVSKRGKGQLRLTSSVGPSGQACLLRSWRSKCATNDFFSVNTAASEELTLNPKVKRFHTPWLTFRNVVSHATIRQFLHCTAFTLGRHGPSGGHGSHAYRRLPYHRAKLPSWSGGL